MLHHHNRGFVDTLEADRRAAAARRRLPSDPDALEELVIAAAAGDQSAWSALHDRFAARIRAVARAHRLGSADVEDVQQTTWLRLLENINSVHEPRRLGAWIDTTARRESLRLLRNAKRERPTEDHELPAEPIPAIAERRLTAANDRAALRLALARLPKRHQRLLRMLFADSPPSYAEISGTLEMPIGSLGPTRARGLVRLRRDADLVAAVRGGVE